MLLRTCQFFRGATPRELRAQLRRLRAVSSAAEGEICKRRRRVRKAQRENASAASSSSFSSASASVDCAGVHVEWLPKNEALESAIALAISENRDARTELEFMRHFLTASLISLASPVGPWDPYDTKPQVFALDNYIALPVFTSLAYLRLFCRRFHFTVRDPSGLLWADGPGDAAEEERKGTGRETPPLPDVSKSDWWGRHVQQHLLETALEPTKQPAAEQEVTTTESAAASACTSWMDANDIFDAVGETSHECDNSTCQKVEHPFKKKKRPSRTWRQHNKRIKKTTENNSGRKGKHPQGGGVESSSEENATPSHDAVREAFWSKVCTTAPFSIAQATPLPMFGPLLRPFFVGYFADVDTLLHNASIVPERVDIVLNPSSPIEFVLAREATDRVLHKDQLLLLAYRRVEKELRGEFHRFLRHVASEVAWARSACIPCPVPGKPDEVKYTLAILLQSDDIDRTFSCLRRAKNHCLLMGHADLDVLPWDAAAPYVQEASTLFYERAVAASDYSCGSQSALGVFEQRGPVQTINVARPAESFYHDPTAAYTEGHAVFTEELKLKRRVR
ncbi:hypothetical protein DQ04_00481030 [Trypanosoma grayi]|uniref:hypothetical protein n=1 Tax=Trypanosoma grayi TaxID=71804 RepID=UPI0004F4281D|nr:hypothetical protein DQ04_00481030 [Trypanosoma grayi]KEG14408.1 hypothetical protein DQ04_00481030 [Trypanosoma grayi]